MHHALVYFCFITPRKLRQCGNSRTKAKTYPNIPEFTLFFLRVYPQHIIIVSTLACIHVSDIFDQYKQMNYVIAETLL